MTAFFIHDGNAIDHIPATDLPHGAVVIQGALVGITQRPINAGALGSLAVTGVFDLPRVTGAAVSTGTPHFWDAATQRATTDAAGGANPRIGVSVAPAGATSELIRLKVNA